MFEITKKLISDPTLSEETKKRIANVQKLLDDSGTKSIHFSWNYEKMQEDQPSAEKVANELCSTMESYFRGEYTELEPDWEKVDVPADILETINASELNDV